MRIAAVIILLAAGSAAADAQVPRRIWKVETSAPVAQRLDLVHGETIDLQCTFLSYASPLDILGASVTLHARTNGMAEGSSFQAAGTAGANGLATVRLAVSEWLPATCTNAEWTLEVAQANAVRILRSYGEARISGSSAASTNDPVPAVWMDDIRADIAAAVADRATTQHVAEAVAEIPRDRIITQDGSQWIDATGGVWRVSYGGGGYWTISILGTLYGSATNAYYEVRSAPFDFWNYDQAFWDGDAYFRWYPDGDPGHGHVYVEVQGVEETHDYNYPTNDLADGVFEFYTSATYTHFVLAWSNDLSSATTQHVDGVAWQSDLSPYATTQTLAAALAPMATTQHVAEAIAAIPEPDLSDRPTFAQTTNIAQSVGGGGSSSIIKPVVTSATNVVVTSTQSVYSVAVTGAGTVGIDWSGLALDGTGRAEITLRINVTEWGGTNVTFAPALMFDQTPEILVTGVWEFAASTIDGVTTRVSQTWPECCGWQPVVITVAGVSSTVGTWWQMPNAATNYVYWQAVNRAGLVRMKLEIMSNYAVDVDLYSSYAAAGNTTFSALDVFQSKTLSFPPSSVGEYTVSIAVPQQVYPKMGVKIWVAPIGEAVRISNLKCRDLNANERAAYAAGWRP